MPVQFSRPNVRTQNIYIPVRSYSTLVFAQAYTLPARSCSTLTLVQALTRGLITCAGFPPSSLGAVHHMQGRASFRADQSGCYEELGGQRAGEAGFGVPARKG